ncbi:MAG TPA: hypothetical protein VHT34_03850 [Clostridia bacterium]|nr:hypothetical protein [Clostridia bacterium]
MNKKSAALKLKLFVLSILVLAVFITLYAYTLVYSKNNFYPTANNGRLLTNTAKLDIEEALAENDFTRVKSQYPFAVIDLKGRVLASTISKFKRGMVVDLNDFFKL